MFGLSFALFLEIIVALLLIGGIVFAYLLQKKIALLRADEERLRTVVASMVDSIHKAEGALHALKNTSLHCEKDLNALIAKAGKIGLEFDQKLESAENVVDRLVHIIDASNSAHSAPRQNTAPTPPASLTLGRGRGNRVA